MFASPVVAADLGLSVHAAQPDPTALLPALPDSAEPLVRHEQQQQRQQQQQQLAAPQPIVFAPAQPQPFKITEQTTKKEIERECGQSYAKFVEAGGGKFKHLSGSDA